MLSTPRTMGMTVVLSVVGGAAVITAWQQRPVQPMKPTGLFLPLAHARDFGDAEITADNNGPAAQSIAVTFIAGGARVDAPAWELGTQASVTRPLNELMPAGVTLANVEGLVLRFEARAVDQIAAQVTLLPKLPNGPSQSVDVTPVVPFDFKSTRLFGVWPTPRGDERAVIVLSNVTNGTVTAQVRGPGAPSDVKLEPLGSTVLTRPAPPDRGADWIEIRGDQGPGAIAATGYVMSPTDHVPIPLRFLDPGIGAQPVLFAGLRIGGPVRLALGNAGAGRPITAVVDFVDADTGELLRSLTPVPLPAQSAVAVDTAPIAALVATPRAVTIRVGSSGSSGDLVASLQTLDPESHLWIDVPLHNAGTDGGTARRGTGNAPWRLDGDYETRFYFTNAGTDIETFWSHVAYGSVRDTTPARSLPASATVMYDVRHMRDTHATDFPHQFPSSATGGLWSWSIRTPPSALLVGRAEIVSASRRVASSFTW